MTSRRKAFNVNNNESYTLSPKRAHIQKKKKRTRDSPSLSLGFLAKKLYVTCIRGRVAGIHGRIRKTIVARRLNGTHTDEARKIRNSTGGRSLMQIRALPRNALNKFHFPRDELSLSREHDGFLQAYAYIIDDIKIFTTLLDFEISH